MQQYFENEDCFKMQLICLGKVIFVNEISGNFFVNFMGGNPDIFISIEREKSFNKIK